MLAVKKIVQFITLVCVSFALGLSGCGGGDDASGETIFVYVLNAYPGSSKLTLYGPTGKVASGLPFGQRSEEAVVVDRNTNSEEFVLLLDGAPAEITFTRQLFSLYPQETATMVITRRSGEASAEASLFRNTRTISPTCVLSFANSLSLNNTFMPEELLSYSYQTQWEIKNQAHYVMSDEDRAETRCGDTLIRSKDTAERKDIIDGVNGDPWLYPVQGETGYIMRWPIRTFDPRLNQEVAGGLTLGGQVRAYRASGEFVECMNSAVSVKTEEDASDPGGGSGGGQECPTPTGPNGTLAESQVVWDELTVSECMRPKLYSGFPVTPGASESQTVFSQGARNIDGEWVCGNAVRVRTPIQDLIFQNKDNSVPGYIDNIGGFVQIDATYPIGEQHYFVLFGRPINPFVSQWNTAEDAIFSDGGEFPYPADAAPQY